MDSKGRMCKANISRKKYNSDFGCPDKEYYNDARMLYISNNTYGYKYFVDESDLIREKNGVEDYIYTFDYKIQSIQDIGDYIFVRTYGINDEDSLGNYNLYLVSKTGNTVKKLAENVGDRGGQ